MPADLGDDEVEATPPRSALRHQLQVPYDSTFGYRSVQYLVHDHVYTYIRAHTASARLVWGKKHIHAGVRYRMQNYELIEDERAHTLDDDR